MPSLPRKARNGDDFKSYTTSAINKLIDYLHSMRPKDSSDIKVKESASGLMFELANRPAKTPQVISVGGGGASGLVATVSGNTASVAVSGSSPLSIVAGDNISITGGANGEVIIGAGSSSLPGIFPVSAGSHTVTENTWYLAQSDGLLLVGYYLALSGETSYSIYYYLDVATSDPNNLSSYTNEENLIARTVTSLNINAPTTSLFAPIKYNQKFRILAKKNGSLYENGAIYGKFYGTFTETTSP